ncbi:hypothetical protein [Streptomyces sp. NRRL F-5123]|uniref:hypothetical protein n=1 Tax=Streptomyces sp. NRRL F-5123 TaxID=1463856 RepID=UPI0004E23B5F|nr:hypothetical protein [Streptomyces sp. NRRL F-5123]
MTDRAAPGSLHALALERRLPAHQPMDQVTLRWIEDNRPANFDAAPSIPRPGLLLVPDRHWFAVPAVADSNHGIRHNGRVSLLAVLLAQEQGLDSDAVAAACIAGAVHDCRRHDDRADHGHGQRAARWLGDHAAAVTRALGHELPEAMLQRAADAVAVHDVPYEQFTPSRERGYQADPFLVDVLKAADCLDRYRLPLQRWWPDLTQLRITVPGWLPPAAFALVVRSEQAVHDGSTPAGAVTSARQSLITCTP